MKRCAKFVLMMGMLACSLRPAPYNLPVKLTPLGPLSPMPLPGMPKFEPMPLYPIRFCCEMSLKCL